MGKRSDFDKVPRDFYPTPKKAVDPLAEMMRVYTFCEPCAGDGRLVEHIEKLFPDAVCLLACDTAPQAAWVIEKDALTLSETDLEWCSHIITNPPFTWKMLKPLMDHWLLLRPTVLLLPADFMHNIRMKPYMDKCVWVKSIGRVKWFEDSKVSGVDNFAWYYFDNNKDVGIPTQFYGRT